MGRKTKEERLAEVHSEALAEFTKVQAAYRDERLQCLQDRRFYSIAGAQWEGVFGEQFENKPKFEVNKIHLSVIRIINEYRNNRITVNFVSEDGEEYDGLAEACDALYRANEQDSVADEAYDNAFEEAVGGGFGAWRLRAEYVDDEDPDDERQRICIEPIYDADSSVFFDMQAKRQDKKDATKCWILSSIGIDAYREEYKDDPTTWPKDIQQLEFDWATPDVVYIAEYYVVEEQSTTIHIWETVLGEELRFTDEELEDELESLEATGARETRTKKVKRKRVHKYIMSGGKVLEDCGYIAGSCIPVVPVYGKRWFVDNVERCMGHVRLAKDAQRLKNMQLSKLGEIAALSPVEKPIFVPEQVAGHQVMWQEGNLKDYPYMLVNPITDQNGQEIVNGPIAYTKPPTVPPSLAALLQITEEDMQDLLGNQQNGETIEGNVSTETALLVQNRLDMQTFIYMSNMAKAVKRCGEIWLGMVRDIFVEPGRKVKGIGPQGEVEHLELLKPVLDKHGKTTYENDLSQAKFEVIAEVGPSSSTKRAATVRSLIAMSQSTDDPETKQVLNAMILMNMEGEGISDIRGYFRKKLLRMGVVDPTEEEREEMAQEAANRQPTPEEEYLRAAAAKEQTEAVKNQAEIIGEQADADKTRAETAKIMADIQEREGRLALDAIEKLGPRVNPPNIPGSDIE